MAIVIMIGCVVLWAAIQSSLVNMGEAPRSRGSLRYLRKKARRLGLDPAAVTVRPRRQQTEVGHGRALPLAGIIGGCCLTLLAACVGLAPMLRGESPTTGDVFFIMWFGGCGTLPIAIGIAQLLRLK